MADRVWLRKLALDIKTNIEVNMNTILKTIIDMKTKTKSGW